MLTRVVATLGKHALQLTFNTARLIGQAEKPPANQVCCIAGSPTAGRNFSSHREE